jgi:hypothetical protein
MYTASYALPLDSTSKQDETHVISSIQEQWVSWENLSKVL